MRVSYKSVPKKAKNAITRKIIGSPELMRNVEKKAKDEIKMRLEFIQE